MNKSPIIPITDLRRNFGGITENLAKLNKIILTKGGEPFAILRAAPEEKRKRLGRLRGTWKQSELDDDKVWQTALKKYSRKASISL